MEGASPVLVHDVYYSWKGPARRLGTLRSRLLLRLAWASGVRWCVLLRVPVFNGPGSRFDFHVQFSMLCQGCMGSAFLLFGRMGVMWFIPLLSCAFLSVSLC